MCYSTLVCNHYLDFDNLFSESTKPDVYASDRRSYFGSLLLRAVTAKPDFISVAYNCKQAGSNISVSLQVLKEYSRV